MNKQKFNKLLVLFVLLLIIIYTIVDGTYPIFLALLITTFVLTVSVDTKNP